MFKKISLLICIGFQCFSQTPSLSVYEKRWAVFHPFAAIKVKKIGKQAAVIYKDISLKSRLDDYSSGGRLDAFRHVFYMAAFAQKIKTKKLRKLGIAHEKGNYRHFRRAIQEEGEVPDSLGSVMDLENNELGLKIGAENKTLTPDELKNKVILDIQNGDARIMKRNKKGNYLDCDDHELPIHILHQWNIPKCLVTSSYVYRD